MSKPASLPTFWEVRAPAAWSAIDFISDLHLSEASARTFEAWAHYLHHTKADAVFILGDLFEAWVGDDSRHAGFEARCADVLAEAASMRTVAFMAGNRDFLVGGDMLRACGVLALSDPTVLIAFGERILLSHGDALCVSDLAYQQFRTQVRSTAWQGDFLSRPLQERRTLAQHMRAESRRLQSTHAPDEWFDVDSATAVRWMHEAGTPTLIHGHTHRPGEEAMAPGFIRYVLTDWDLDQAGAPRAEVLRWRRAGLTRVAPEHASSVTT